MKYEKPQVEVIQFDEGSVFMTASSFSNPFDAALYSNGVCNGISGSAKSGFKCPSFQGYTMDMNIKNKTSVTVEYNGATYSYDYRGQNWHCTKING